MSKLSPSNRTADCFSDRGECCFCLPIGARHRSTTPPDAKLSGSLDGGVTSELFQIPERANHPWTFARFRHRNLVFSRVVFSLKRRFPIVPRRRCYPHRGLDETGFRAFSRTVLVLQLARLRPCPGGREIGAGTDAVSKVAGFAAAFTANQL